MRSASLFAVAVLTVILALSSFSPVAASGAITVKKLTTNGDATTIFEFRVTAPCNPNCIDFAPLFLAGGEEGPLKYISGSNVYTVKEVVPDGWVLYDISCEGPPVVGREPSSFEFILGVGVIITLVAPDSVTCTFTNCPVGNCPSPEAVGGAVTTVNTFSVLAPWLAVIGLIGCVGTAVVVGRKRHA